MQIADYLLQHDVPFETLFHPPAFSAQMRAKTLRVPGRRVAKSVLLRGPEGFFVAVLPATHTIDCPELGRALGGEVRLATYEEASAVFHDCEWGVVPPFGNAYRLPVILDESLPRDAIVVFEANTHVEAVRIRCADFERTERPRRIAFARFDPRN
jgi:Ala-tRNA(Pro) deacylase